MEVRQSINKNTRIKTEPKPTVHWLHSDINHDYNFKLLIHSYFIRFSVIIINGTVLVENISRQKNQLENTESVNHRNYLGLWLFQSRNKRELNIHFYLFNQQKHLQVARM